MQASAAEVIKNQKLGRQEQQRALNGVEMSARVNDDHDRLETSYQGDDEEFKIF